MKRISKIARIAVLFTVVMAVAIGGVGLLTSCNRSPSSGASASAKEKTLYTCGMHPRVVQDTPGNCPICGMKLTPIRKQASTSAPASTPTGERKIQYYKSSMMAGEVSPTPKKDSMGMEMVPVYEEATGAADSSAIGVDPAMIQTMGIRTARVTRGPLRRMIRTVGTIDYNEATLADVTTKFKGWIEKLYVDTTGQQVHRGDPLFEIYSPDLYSAQMEYVLANGTGTNSSVSADNLSRSALTKLKYFDISDKQIADLERTKQPRKTLRIQAPIDGFVVDKMIVEGQMIEAGMKIYRLADLSLVWVQAQIYEQDLAYIKLGQEATVTLSYLADRQFRGRVTYIYPAVDEKTRTARVRMEFHNPGFFLKPGMFAEVRVEADLDPSVLLIPDMAILRSGEKNTVFVALAGGRFEPRTVTLGPQAENDYYQALSGVSEGELIVTSGQFMLDSESQLREAIQKMQQPQTAPPAAGSTVASVAVTENPSTDHQWTRASGSPESAGDIKYICPMPEHVSIEYDHPGRCPICGMTLVPVTASVLHKLPPGGRVLYYTCPMPEHSDIHSDKPGKCPKCSMTLIPIMEAPAAANLATNQIPAEKPAVMPTALYTCPMATHADVVSDKPGKCPKCEMDLVPTSTVSHGKTAEEHWRKQHAH